MGMCSAVCLNITVDGFVCLYTCATASKKCTVRVGGSESHLESVVWEVCNGDCLHQGGDICQNKHNSRKSQPLTDARRLLHSICRSPQHNVRERMIEAKISMRHKVQCNGNLQHHRAVLKDCSAGGRAEVNTAAATTSLSLQEGNVYSAPSTV